MTDLARRLDLATLSLVLPGIGSGAGLTLYVTTETRCSLRGFLFDSKMLSNEDDLRCARSSGG
jgi:hypothetical protein